MKTLLSLALCCLSAYCYAININGVVLLQGAADHSGVTIQFIPKSPSAVANEVISLSDGSYSANVVAGVYDIRFSKPGYDVNLITDQFISTSITLSQFVLANAPPENVSGNVSGTWVNTKTYVVTGNIAVPSGTELVIQPGTTVKFAGYFRMQVYGKLTALGTGTQKILITSTASSKARGDWAGIEIYTNEDTTRFDHCQVEYGGNEMDNKAVIYNNGKLRISNSLIRGGGYGGVYNSTGGYVKLHRSEITDCYFYGYAGGTAAVGASVTYNHIHHNTLIGASCAWTVDEFIGNEVDHNGYTGVQAYGFGLYERNLLHHNPQGIFVVADKPTIRFNTIVNNNEGIRFYDSDFWHPSAIVHSNIIAYNNIWGIYCEGVYKPETVQYNVIYSNSNGVANIGPVGLGSVITTNARGFASDTYMNIFEVPGFVTMDESSDDYLKLSSRCASVDTGDPRFKDPDGSITDCGAVPFEKAFQDITFDALAAKTFGDNDFMLSASVSTNLPLTFTSSNTAITTIQGNTVTITGGGKAMISAVQAGDIDYRPTQVTRELLVNPKNQLITFAPLAPKTFGDANFTVTASSTSNLPVTFVSSDENIAFVNGNEITIKAGGTVNITARQTGNANYSAAPEVTQQLTINPATQLITFNTLPPFEFHESPYELQASASSQLPVRYTTSNENVAVIKDNILTFKNIGTVTITAYQDGNASYQSAPQVSRDLIILKGEQRITFDSIASKVFGEANFTLAASSSSGLPIEFESSDNAIASVNGNTVTIKAAGSAMITAHQNGNANYKAAPDSSRYLVIGKANQTITFNTLSAKTFGDDNFTLSATTSSSLPVTFISSDESIVMIQGNVVTIKASGAVNITASQQGNTNYNKANDVTRELLINKRTQSISFAISTKTFGDSDFILTASATSNLPVSFEALSDHIAVTGTSVKLLKPGRTGIKAMQVGDKNYTSSDLTRSFCVNPARPSITMQFNSQGVPVLTSSNENGNQWYYKGQVLEGETGKTLLTKTGGNYTVTSKVEDCISEASIPFTLLYTGTEDVFSEFNLSVFPNPAKDWIVLRMSASTDPSYSFKLKSIVGATVLEGVALSPGETPILLTGLSAGIYILNIYDKAHSYTIRLIKE